jgi:hypothetical protein
VNRALVPRVRPDGRGNHLAGGCGLHFPIREHVLGGWFCQLSERAKAQLLNPVAQTLDGLGSRDHRWTGC